jgi:ParB-like chromosome segregation protein Spo0J
MYRLSCSKDLGLLTIPGIIVSASDEEALMMQIEANMQRPPTKRSEFALHLKRLFAADCDLTFEALSARLHKNPGWIRSMLRLNRLSDACKKELDAGNLTLIAAYAICRLPQVDQDKFLPNALCMSGKDAASHCIGMMKEYTENLRQGKLTDFYASANTPKPFLRSYRSILQEYKTQLIGSVIVAELKNTSPLEVWRQALAWVLHLDSLAVEAFENKEQMKANKAECEIVERRLKRANLKTQREIELSQDWRYPLVDE